MLKYYVAEGVMSQHAVLIASADPSPDKLLKVKHCIGTNVSGKKCLGCILSRIEIGNENAAEASLYQEAILG